MKYFFQAAIFVVFLFSAQISSCQYSRQDTLRGSLSPERTWWDVLAYDITVTPDYTARTIRGSETITFLAKKSGTKMQIDLQEPMELDHFSIKTDKGPVACTWTREGNVWWITMPAITAGTKYEAVMNWHGKPRIAKNPPWDGGWIWKQDEMGNPWMSVACQGLGASVWYPCKDYQGDEPDEGASLTIIVADSLSAIANGRLISKTSAGSGMQAWKWAVKNPINNYDIIPYIGKYSTWHDTYKGEKGVLDLDYWVLSYNVDKAKQQFGRDVKPMLQCFEDWFGPYPFYEDGYKLVEAPHLGMEHQSAVAYGNKYMNGYLGGDLSGTGWGKKWDYIIVHESGHEWFGNNITTNDIADMWVHEGFTDYSEPLFVECQFGKKAGDEYCQGLRRNIDNDKPVIGPYGVNTEGSGDMYAKGANMLHTIRQVIDDDARFKSILRGLNRDFYHKTTTSAEVEKYVSEKAGKDLSKIFDQYLRTVNIPVLEYSLSAGGAGKSVLKYRWNNVVNQFTMPLRIFVAGKPVWLQPGSSFKTITLDQPVSESLQVDRNFYIDLKKIK